MTDEKLNEALKHFIQNGSDFQKEVIDVLLEYKISGGQQGNAQIIAENLRKQFHDNEGLEDKVLDILDIIVGWCKPELRIWD